ncbi:MAG: two-component system sensor histidine kinase UhpB [Flavobacteriales bacterium]|jgi:two-component system sensor histidine kinase UhpB
MNNPNIHLAKFANLFDETSGEPLRILILEDKASEAAVIKLELRKIRFEHQIEHAIDRDSFEKLFAKFKPQLVLSDYNLPQYTGLDALKYTREQSPYIPFILCTGRVNEETAVRCIKEGADDYILKESLTRLISACELAIKHKNNLVAKQTASVELKQSEENFRALSENAPNRIYKISQTGEILYLNRPFDNLSLDQIIGASIFDHVGEQHHDALKESMKRAWDQKTNVRLELSSHVDDPLAEWYLTNIGPVLKDGQVESLIFIPSDITEKKIAEIELNELNTKLHELSQHLENVRDEEKKRISMEIHDQLGQELTGSKLGLYWIKQHFQQNGLENANLDAVFDKIDYLVDLTTQTIQTVRRIAHQLRPVVLDNIGLIPALEWHIENYNENHETKAHLTINTGNLNFEKDVSTAIYRIVQEALTNIDRHAKANQAKILLYTTEDELKLEIEDDGVGIDVVKARKSKSLGLFGIHERIKRWEGKIDIEGVPAQGTKIHISIDLEKLKTNNYEPSHHM